MIDINSKYYPYCRVNPSYTDLRQYASLPRLICDYLLDAPDAVNGYTPKDDNDYPRCRLWKKLFYDGEHPEKNPLPSIEQKISVLFNPAKPTSPPDISKGYRLIPQEYLPQSQEMSQTRIYCYLGRMIAQREDYTYVTSVIFDVWTHYTFELDMKTEDYSRTASIVADIVEALNGVNMTGIGTFSLSKSLHPDSGIYPISDGNTNIGKRLIIGLGMATEENVIVKVIEEAPRNGNSFIV